MARNESDTTEVVKSHTNTQTRPPKSAGSAGSAGRRHTRRARGMVRVGARAGGYESWAGRGDVGLAEARSW